MFLGWPQQRKRSGGNRTKRENKQKTAAGSSVREKRVWPRKPNNTTKTHLVSGPLPPRSRSQKILPAYLLSLFVTECRSKRSEEEGRQRIVARRNRDRVHNGARFFIISPERISAQSARRSVVCFLADPQSDVAPGKPGAAMCVRNVDVQCVLQFTLFHAVGCVLHRPTSRVIHRLELYLSLFISFVFKLCALICKGYRRTRERELRIFLFLLGRRH